MPLFPIAMRAHPDNFFTGRAGQTVGLVVIHIMDGTLAGTAAWFATGKADRLKQMIAAWEKTDRTKPKPTRAGATSTHYGVGKDGTLHQYVAEKDAAFHAGGPEAPFWPGLRKAPDGSIINPNLYSIGIEFEGRGGDQFTDAQYNVGAELLKEIAVRHGIALSTATVVRHSMISPKSRPGTCPGAGCDMDKLIAQANTP